MPIIAFFFSPIGRIVAIGVAALALFGGIYIKGRSDGKAAYQAALTRQANKAIANGNRAEAEALKRFDLQKDLTDDGNARD